MDKRYIDKKFLYSEYITKEKSVKQIRREYGWGINFGKEGYENFWELITLYDGIFIIDAKLEPKD